MKLTVFLFLCGLSTAVYAYDKPKPVTIAVFGIASNNTAPSTGKAAAEILSGHLFRSQLFTLLDRNQIEHIAAREGITVDANYDISLLANLGKQLSVQKIITGSINKIGSSFILEIRSIDVTSTTVDTAITEKFSETDDFETAITNAAIKLERYYLGYDLINGTYDLTIAASMLIPFGKLTKTFTFAPGAIVEMGYNKPFNYPISIACSIAYYYPVDLPAGVARVHLLPLRVLVCKRYRPAKNIYITPGAGAGLLMSYIKADPDRTMYNSQYRYKKGIYGNLFLAAKLSCDIFLVNRSYLFLSPSYTFIPDPVRQGHVFQFDFGIKYIY